jgi:heme-degrading monooxygenase HmoA
LAYVILWEFRIDTQREAEFVRHYGPDGSWAQFFRGSKGYIRTELLRDVVDRLRFVTLDYWQSQEEFNRFREQNQAEYQRLDKEFEGLTEKETRLGTFQAIEL